MKRKEVVDVEIKKVLNTEDGGNNVDQADVVERNGVPNAMVKEGEEDRVVKEMAGLEDMELEELDVVDDQHCFQILTTAAQGRNHEL